MGKYLFLQPIIFLFMLQQMDIKHLIRRRQLCIGLMQTWILVPISIWLKHVALWLLPMMVLLLSQDLIMAKW